MSKTEIEKLFFKFAEETNYGGSKLHVMHLIQFEEAFKEALNHILNTEQIEKQVDGELAFQDLKAKGELANSREEIHRVKMELVIPGRLACPICGETKNINYNWIKKTIFFHECQKCENVFKTEKAIMGRLEKDRL